MGYGWAGWALMATLTDHLQGHSRDILAHLSPAPCPCPGGRQKVPRVMGQAQRSQEGGPFLVFLKAAGVCAGNELCWEPAVSSGGWEGLEW